MIRFIDLFCGIGGFRYGFEQACDELGIKRECVFSSDIDVPAQKSYAANFGHTPHGDITKIESKDIPDHDVLLAGFPCQAFSIIGDMKGFEDTRGTLFFDIARILFAKKPSAFILENVKQLVGHDKGRTLEVILDTLDELGYTVKFKVLNALDYGLPQKRERCIIVGHRSEQQYKFPSKVGAYKPLEHILEPFEDVSPKHYASEHILTRRRASHRSEYDIAIWHENKAGNISSYPYSCALRANASYNYLLVNGERRLTPRECLRLQGFPENFNIVVNDGQIRKQAGNAVPVNIVRAVATQLLPLLENILGSQRITRPNAKTSRKEITRQRIRATT